MLTEDEKRDALGILGEKIVQNYFTAQGKLVFPSEKKYDAEKDMMIAGKTAEVKTQCPFITKSVFTIRASQVNKVRSVQELYFVAIPHKKYKSGLVGYVYSVDPVTHIQRDGEYYKDGNKREFIDIIQPAVKKLFSLTYDQISEAMNYQVSEYY